MARSCSKVKFRRIPGKVFTVRAGRQRTRRPGTLRTPHRWRCSGRGGLGRARPAFYPGGSRPPRYARPAALQPLSTWAPGRAGTKAGL